MTKEEKMKFLLLLIVMANIALAQPPEIEDFVLKGYETSNFKNVLLDPDSPISDFYLITDVGTVLKVKNMGLDPQVQKVYTFDGEITEAISNEDTHYLSLAGETETMLIATKNFIDIDTIYSESNAQITDFRIENNTIYLLSNDGSEGKIYYSPIGTTNWSDKDIPDVTYNRIFVIDTLVVLFKYMDKDVTLNYLYDMNDEWKHLTKFEINNIDLYYDGYSDLKKVNNTIGFFGDSRKIGNIVYFFNNEFKYVNAHLSAPYNNILNDIGFENEFNFDRKLLHIGNYLTDCECAYLFRFTYNGDVEQNMYYFPNSKSLNKINSNKRSKNIQFVAVGNDGLILLINRSRTSVEKEKELVFDETTFSIYPNPIKEENELRIESEELIKSISITDMMGKRVVHYMMIDLFKYEISMSSFRTGVYFIKVNGKTQKFIVE